MSYRNLYQICEWHAYVMQALEAMLDDRMEIAAKTAQGERIVLELSEEEKRGFKIALTLIRVPLSEFPLEYSTGEEQ